MDVAGSLGNIANIVVCALSAVVAAWLAWKAGRRFAAVGKSEMRILLVIYGLTAVLQLLDTGAFLTQGSVALVWVTGFHVGLVVAL